MSVLSSELDGKGNASADALDALMIDWIECLRNSGLPNG
jgi:hypothetical protein